MCVCVCVCELLLPLPPTFFSLFFVSETHLHLSTGGCSSEGVGVDSQEGAGQWADGAINPACGVMVKAQLVSLKELIAQASPAQLYLLESLDGCDGCVCV